MFRSDLTRFNKAAHIFMPQCIFRLLSLIIFDVNELNNKKRLNEYIVNEWCVIS